MKDSLDDLKDSIKSMEYTAIVVRKKDDKYEIIAEGGEQLKQLN